MKHILTVMLMAVFAVMVYGCRPANDYSIDITGSSDFTVTSSDDDTTAGDGNGDVSGASGCNDGCEDSGQSTDGDLCSTSCTQVEDESCFRNGGTRDCVECSSCEEVE